MTPVKKGGITTADTGFANEANMKFLHDTGINAYVPDNQFRSRDPKFAEQKKKYGKRHQDQKKIGRVRNVIPPSEFNFDPINLICVCPAGETLSYQNTRTPESGAPKPSLMVVSCNAETVILRTSACKTQPQQITEKEVGGRYRLR